MKALALSILLLFLVGCATTAWSPVDDAARQHDIEGYSLQLPAGWMRNQSTGDLVLSRDGVDLQRIILRYRTHDKAFEKLQRASRPETLPSELAELAIAEIKAGQDDGIPSLEVLNNTPFAIADHTGFAVHLRFKTGEGLRIEVLAVGFSDAHGFYQLLYRAPSLHYFENDRQTFESLVRSLQPRS